MDDHDRKKWFKKKPVYVKIYIKNKQEKGMLRL